MVKTVIAAAMQQLSCAKGFVAITFLLPKAQTDGWSNLLKVT
jgi:hypothetical protein